jgi:hypothetical protein
MVRYLARKAKKLARKWGGQCIVFIDEIDAVGMRRQALQGQRATVTPELPLYGPFGALNPSGDLIVETRAWRDQMFEQRAPERFSPYPAWMRRVGNLVNQGVFPGMMGGGQGQLALNQLLVTMDGIDNPPFMRRFLTNRINSFLDAIYIAPRRIGRMSLRLRPPRPLKAQIYFIGATNVPMEVLDPALTRPGRMGRHVWFRTPTKEDRKDIFDLYLDRVTHDPDLDTPQRRDEIARITNGYSPAMIEQICSMALTNAHHEGQMAFGWDHLVDAMTGIESGTAIGVRYGRRTRAVAIHEAGTPPRRTPTGGDRVEPPDQDARQTPGHHQFFDRESAAAGRARTRAISSTPSARWRPSTSSTARTRAASAATSAWRRAARRRWSVSGACRPCPSTSRARSSTMRRKSRHRSESSSGSRTSA